jgi:hypothetical protein
MVYFNHNVSCAGIDDLYTHLMVSPCLFVQNYLAV